MWDRRKLKDADMGSSFTRDCYLVEYHAWVVTGKRENLRAAVGCTMSLVNSIPHSLPGKSDCFPIKFSGVTRFSYPMAKLEKSGDMLCILSLPLPAHLESSFSPPRSWNVDGGDTGAESLSDL